MNKWNRKTVEKIAAIKAGTDKNLQFFNPAGVGQPWAKTEFERAQAQCLSDLFIDFFGKKDGPCSLAWFPGSKHVRFAQHFTTGPTLKTTAVACTVLPDASLGAEVSILYRADYKKATDNHKFVYMGKWFSVGYPNDPKTLEEEKFGAVAINSVGYTLENYTIQEMFALGETIMGVSDPIKYSTPTIQPMYSAVELWNYKWVFNYVYPQAVTA